MKSIVHSVPAKGLFSLLLVLLLAAAAIGVTATEVADTVTVYDGVLTLWSKPALDSEVITVYPSNTTLEILGREGDFYQVLLPDGNTGYMEAAYIYAFTDPETSTDMGQIIGGELQLLAEPSPNAAVVAVYDTGAEMAIQDQEGDYYYVTMVADNNTGYMDDNYVYVDTGDLTVIGKVGRVVGGELSLREEPSADAASMGVYDSGTLVFITGEGDGFYHVIMPDGKIGYMETDFVFVY